MGPSKTPGFPRILPPDKYGLRYICFCIDFLFVREQDFFSGHFPQKGNTDFLNMLSRHRLTSKKKSKTEAVQSVTSTRLDNDNIHIGPSDYVPWQKDNKISFVRMEGKLFGDVPMNIELRLSVEDSPNSAGVAIDAIRCAKLALCRGQGGVLEVPSAYFCKYPPHQFTNDEAFQMVERFIEDTQMRRRPEQGRSSGLNVGESKPKPEPVT